jgi:HSP20 family protein
MRRSEDYLPTRRTQSGGLMPSGQVRGYGSPFFSASPWQMMRRMQEDMDRVFGQFFDAPSAFSGGQAGEGASTGLQQWAPNVDVSESDKEWCIEAELPGVKKDDVDVQVRDQYLILRARLNADQEQQGKGEAQGSTQQGDHEKKNGQHEQPQQRQYHQRERRWGYFERVLTLPDNADEEKIACDFENGVLTVHIPKAEPAQQQGRRIPISAGQTGGPSGQKAESRPQQERHEERAPAGAGSGSK